MREYRGSFLGAGLKFGVVVSRFNELVTTRLLQGAKDCLLRHGVAEEDILVAWTPGSFELPLVAKKLAMGRKHDGVICLGAIIRGDTPHFDYIASEVTRRIGEVNLETGVPVILGVLTADTLEQALERSGAKENRGFQAALTALEMANLLKILPL